MAALCLRFGVATLYAFGSRGREALDYLHGRTGAMSGASDVDVGVRPVSGRVWTLDDKVAMAIALEDLLGCGRVDSVSRCCCGAIHDRRRRLTRACRVESSQHRMDSSRSCDEDFPSWLSCGGTGSVPARCHCRSA